MRHDGASCLHNALMQRDGDAVTQSHDKAATRQPSSRNDSIELARDQAAKMRGETFGREASTSFNENNGRYGFSCKAPKGLRGLHSIGSHDRQGWGYAMRELGSIANH